VFGGAIVHVDQIRSVRRLGYVRVCGCGMVSRDSRLVARD
jgi:hypothetical protein